MQWILSVFAMTWNREHGFTGQGSVWGQRFFSTILGTLAHYLHAFLYIDTNPVSAGLVSLPEHWEWGGPSLRAGHLGCFFDDPPEDLGCWLFR
jgi:hypothetical protein